MNYIEYLHRVFLNINILYDVVFCLLNVILINFMSVSICTNWV